MSRHRQVSAVRHPKASSSGCVYEHILIAERALGRYLPDGAEIHHVDENPRNNTNSNLVICQDGAYHKLLHARARIVRAGGNPDTQALCGMCRRLKLFSEFSKRTGDKALGLQRRCRECANASNAEYMRCRKSSPQQN